MQWTAGQQAAIDARNDSVLVSAAAGSGKTAVLVERVMALLREGGRIDRMLIVTFTRAAAGEMRERIGRRLDQEGEASAHLRRQALRLNRAAICTLHVFCARVLRDHFQAAEVDPMARIADEDRLDALRKRALDEEMEALYAEPDQDGEALISQFEDGQIAEMAEQLYGFLMAQAEPWAWAESMCREENAALTHWMPLLEEQCRSRLAQAGTLLPQMEAILSRGDGPDRYQPAFDADSALMRQLLKEAEKGVLSGGKTAFARLSTKKPSPQESPEAAETYKALREQWKEKVNNARKALPEDLERAEKDIAHTLPALRALCALTRRMHERYFALKQAKNYLDYNDLEHLTLKALQNADVRARVAGQFDALFIDEYQDVSGIQEAILRALHTGGNSLFMVGDVKQSIYRFRLADPTLFLRKYRDFSLAEDARERKILLQQNFRSDDNVLLAVNQVFRHAMREKETEIEYDQAAMLRPGGGRPFGAPVEIHVIAASDEDGDDAVGEVKQGYRYEAAFVARRIKELMRMATVREDGIERPMRYRDIALLLRNVSGRAPYIARTLQAEGIPVYSDADAQFFDLPEVRDLMNLLRVIDNPFQDIPLLSALRCPCFGFTEEELARIRLVDRTPGTPFHLAFLNMTEKEGPLGEKAARAWEQLASWRFLAMNLPVDQLVWQVLEKSGLYMRAGAMGDGELRQANLRLMAERAQGESAREGLSAFLRETGRIRASDDGKSAKTLGENEDVVRILTLHKSKGLEFPVVFLLEGARNFRLGDDGPLRLHSQAGMALKYIDGEQRLTHETCAMRALKGVGEKEARAEECRLLYVGMTRARERLILVGSPLKTEQALEKWRQPASASAAGSAKCMLDWVLVSLGGFRPGEVIGENGSVWHMALEKADDLSGRGAWKAVTPPAPATVPADEKTAARLSRRITPQPPLKTSVTALSKRLRDEKDDWESPADKRRLPQEPEALPAFLRDQSLTAAQKGTLAHRALGLIDYDLVRQRGVPAALDALTRSGLMTGAEKNALRTDWLERFFSSPLGRRALQARQLHREWAFNMKGEGQGLIQGVIDLCFAEDGQWVLVDYKTDAADGEELLARYSPQLRWYARALASITGMPVREALLFALRSGEAYAVAL